MVTLNPPARLAATSAAPGGCCSLLYHLFYLSNDGNAVGYKQSELGLDKNFGLSVCLGAPTRYHLGVKQEFKNLRHIDTELGH